MILKQIKPHGRVLNLNLTAAYGHLLSRDVRADHDIPPFTNSAMDGYAVRSDVFASRTAEYPIRLKVVGTSAAGHPISARGISPVQCYRIMTGAPVPEDADAVVQSEWTQLDPEEKDVIWVSRPVPKGGGDAGCNCIN